MKDTLFLAPLWEYVRPYKSKDDLPEDVVAVFDNHILTLRERIVAMEQLNQDCPEFVTDPKAKEVTQQMVAYLEQQFSTALTFFEQQMILLHIGRMFE